MMGFPQQKDGQNSDSLLLAPDLQPRAASVSPQEMQTGQALVLIVEDNLEMSRFIARTLATMYRTVIAHDGQEGLSQALALEPDLILCDVMMPRMSGDELVYAVRAHPELDAIPIVLLSGRADDPLRAQLLRAGAQDYLVKPFHPEELRVRVANLIKMKETHQLLQREVAGQYQDIAALANQVTARTHELQSALDVLRENEARTGAILQTALDAIITIDHQGHVIEWNPAAEQMFGYNRREALGRAIADLIMLPSSREQHRQGLSHYLATAEQHMLGRRFETTALRANGTEFPVELAITRIPLEGTAMFTSFVRDITERKRADTERRRLERQTREALDALLAMAEALVSIPAEAATTNVQAAEAREVTRPLAELASRVLGCRRLSITAIEPESELLRPVAIFGLSAEQEQQWAAGQQEVRLSESPYQSLVSRLRAREVLLLDLTRPPLDNYPTLFGVRTILIAPMSIEDRLVGFLSVDYGDATHDYTADECAVAQAVAHFTALILERQRLLRERAAAESRELALHEANQRMDTFLGIAGHELRTPLTSLIASIQFTEKQFRRLANPEVLSQEEVTSKAKAAQERLVEAGRHLWRLNRLVGELLDVSRIRANKITLQMERCDLAAIARRAVDEQRRVKQARHIALEVRTAEPVPILADADRIGQVVTNYLTNAFKYAPVHLPITVVLQVEEQMARLSVHDEGPGVAPSEQERIWERFYRVPGIDVQSGSHVGLGLGLYICRTIIEEHQGRVGVESMPGSGSIFWFTLPLVSQDEERSKK